MEIEDVYVFISDRPELDLPALVYKVGREFLHIIPYKPNRRCVKMTVPDLVQLIIYMRKNTGSNVKLVNAHNMKIIREAIERFLN
uniref:Uncharacterized protein n=1 Tax=Metallosphaera hakonensis JCM 8857 = DSM 7519 TaxID=1293036 RepID=A0A2U9IRM1_9CREN